MYYILYYLEKLRIFVAEIWIQGNVLAAIINIPALLYQGDVVYARINNMLNQ